MKGVFILIALVAFAALTSEVNGQEEADQRERLGGKPLVDALAKSSSSIQCYECLGCSDNKDHISDADLKPCTGSKLDPRTVKSLGLTDTGTGYTVAVLDTCAGTPTDLQCFINRAQEYGILLSDHTNLDKCKAELEAGAKKLTVDAGTLLTAIGSGLLYYKPVCTISFGADTKVTARTCNPAFLDGISAGGGPIMYAGVCGEDFKQISAGGASKVPAWCSCDKTKCNGGSFAKPSVAALVFSFVLATFVYGKNQF